MKSRVDQLLVDRGLAESRTRAQALVMAGLVFAGDRKVDKPGQTIAADAAIEVRGRDHPWVSRGGIKLAHALDRFGWDVAGAVAIDVGSSTGGFTDVLLQRGAARVYAVDSGTNQLAWKLRQDPRVIVLEQTRARILTEVQIPEAIDLLVCDASFIGLVRGNGRLRSVFVEVVLLAVGPAAVVVGQRVAGIERSPITGPEGNVEFLLGATLAGVGDE